MWNKIFAVFRKKHHAAAAAEPERRLSTWHVQMTLPLDFNAARRNV